MRGDPLIDMSKRSIVQSREIPTTEELVLGCQQRIADAVEKLAVNHDQMKANLDSEKQMRNFYQTRCRNLERKVAALKGVVTKLRRKAVG